MKQSTILKMTNNKTTCLDVSTNVTLVPDIRGRLFRWDFELTPTILIITGAMLMIWNCVALITINCSQRTLKPVRFFSSALVSSELSSLIVFTARKLTADQTFINLTETIGSHFLLLSFTTVCLMSAERLVIFSTKKIITLEKHFRSVWKASVTTWLLLTVVYYGTRYGICQLIPMCISAMETFFGAVLLVTTISSITCYVRVYFLIIHASPTKELRGQMSRHRLRATGLTFMYLVVTVFGFCSFVVNAFLQLDIHARRLQIDIFNLVSCAVDPLLHVWWFKECQMKLLEVLSVCRPSLRRRIEKIKSEIFDIVTYRK